MKNLRLFVFASLSVFTGCLQDENYSEIFKDLTIQIESSDELFADSISTARIRANFNQNLIKEQEVEFSTSNGTLFQMPYNPNLSGSMELTFAPFSDEAEVLLKTNTLTPDDEVFITITINGFSRDTIIRFIPAKPEDMIVTALPQRLVAGQNALITAHLFRKPGFTSNGIKFRVRHNLEFIGGIQDTTLLSLPEFVFSKNNQLQFTVDIQKHVPGSNIRVFVSTEGANGNTIEKSILLYLE